MASGGREGRPSDRSAPFSFRSTVENATPSRRATSAREMLFSSGLITRPAPGSWRACDPCGAGGRRLCELQGYDDVMIKQFADADAVVYFLPYRCGVSLGGIPGSDLAFEDEDDQL